MNHAFTPQNDLEHHLVAAQQGALGEHDFMHALLTAQVFMPIHDKHGIGGLQTSKSAVPLTLQTDDGFEVVALFTSPERAKDFVKAFPGYEGGLLAEFAWVLERIGSGLGLTLNPGWETGLDMEPDTVNQLRSEGGEQ